MTTSRAPRDSDVPALAALRNDLATQYALLAAPRPNTLAEVRAWIARRARDPDAPADFWFPHMSEPAAHPGWAPNFVDYLYLSYTNSTALSPTDTMPMTTRVKLLMMGQSISSLITVLLVASRAVNILH